MIKQFFRERFPATHDFLWMWKEYTKQYLYPEKRFAKYYRAALSWMHEPEPILAELALPLYIDTVIDLGCGSGRNFIPLDGKFDLIGYDIVPEAQIKWVRPFKNLTYHQGTVETFIGYLECNDVDLSRTLVMAFFTLMYVTRKNQERLYRVCKARGCKNFLFQEYPPGKGPYQGKWGQHFKLSVADFVQIKHPASLDETMTYLQLDVV